MHKLKFILRKYTNNFLLLDDITSYNKIEYFNFNNIVTVTDSNIVKNNSINKLINFFKEKFNSDLIILD